MTEKEIIKYIKGFELDIRKRGPIPRPFDQKVTPDILRAVSYAILSFSGASFSNSDIIKSTELKDVIELYFGKPTPDNPHTSNEYDKFIGQITNFYEYVGVLEKVNRKYRILNSDAVQYNSISFENSATFIAISFEEILKSSGFWCDFESYLLKTMPTSNDFYALRDKFMNFIWDNTNIKGEFEPRRIIAKVLNPIAFRMKTYGAKHGSASKKRIILRDLLYSMSDNSRDAFKKKDETRAEANIRLKKSTSINKAMNLAKEYMKEVWDHKSAVSGQELVQMHHIFPSSQFPQFKAIPENLIPLTAQEHLMEAHPNNNTRIIDEEYQLKLIKIQHAKIRQNPNKMDEDFFIEMVKDAIPAYKLEI